MKRANITAMIMVTAIACLILLALNHRTVSSVENDPTGQYVAITSYKTYLSFFPMPPGSSSDKASIVKIMGKDGTNYGEMPVSLGQMAGVRWSPGGASIDLIGSWDFEKHTCTYWTEDGLEHVCVK